ncbi:MAG: guanylate kinase [Cyanophyceae cyanobacterium]
MKESQLIVITGPSGVGKGTLVRSLLARHPELVLAVSATTRKPRPGEADGKDYHFVTEEQFQRMIESNLLLEWAEYAANYYGTPRSAVEEQISHGKSVILEIEVLGARKIKHSFPDALRLFVLPPSMEELERRLRARGNVPEAAIIKRLERAKLEVAASAEFDYSIVNDDFDRALSALEAVIFKQPLRDG